MTLKQKLRELIIAGGFSDLKRYIKKFNADTDILEEKTPGAPLGEFDGTEFDLSPSCLLIFVAPEKRLKVCSLTPNEQMLHEMDKECIEHIEKAVAAVDTPPELPPEQDDAAKEAPHTKKDNMGRAWEYNPPPERIAELIERLKGRGGKEDESCINENAWDTADGFVGVYCGHGSRAARILTRCGSKVRRLFVAELKDSAGNVTHTGLSMDIDISAFRGLEYAFKKIDNKTEMTDEAKARLAAIGKDDEE